MEDMPLDQLVPSESKYMQKEDVGEEGRNLTIRGFKRELVGTGADADERAIMAFQEDVKPMVLNKTNMQRLKHITKAETTGQAVGRVVNVYSDPMVEFGGKLVGGLRIRPSTTDDRVAARNAAGLGQQVPAGYAQTGQREPGMDDGPPDYEEPPF